MNLYIDWYILGGDQMTCTRVWGERRNRSNSDRDINRLQGLTGVLEDWHAKMCLLGVRYELYHIVRIAIYWHLHFK